MAVIEVNVQDFFAISQSDKHSPKSVTAQNTLSVSQNARSQFLNQNTHNNLVIYQTVSCRTSIKNLSIADTLIMYIRGARTYVQNLTEFFFMWQEAKSVKYEVITQALNILQTVTCHVSKNGTNTLVMNQSATCTGIWNREGDNTLVIHSSGNAYKAFDKYWSSIALPTLTGPNAPEC